MLGPSHLGYPAGIAEPPLGTLAGALPPLQLLGEGGGGRCGVQGGTWGSWGALGGCHCPSSAPTNCTARDLLLQRWLCPLAKCFGSGCISNRGGGWRAGVSQRSRRASPWANAARRPRYLAFRLAFLSCVLPWREPARSWAFCAALVYSRLRRPALGRWLVVACVQAALPARSWVGSPV